MYPEHAEKCEKFSNIFTTQPKKLTCNMLILYSGVHALLHASWSPSAQHIQFTSHARTLSRARYYWKSGVLLLAIFVLSFGDCISWAVKSSPQHLQYCITIAYISPQLSTAFLAVHSDKAVLLLKTSLRQKQTRILSGTLIAFVSLLVISKAGFFSCAFFPIVVHRYLSSTAHWSVIN